MKWRCPKCGKLNEQISGICNKCIEIRPNEVEFVESAMDAAIAASPVSSGAGFGLRLLARLVDLLFCLVVAVAVGFVVVFVFAVLAHAGALPADWVERLGRDSLAGLGFGILGAFLYQAASEGIGGTSIGKLLCGLRVVQIDGRPVGIKGSVIRNLGYHVDALFFGLVGLSSMQKGPLKQRYGDVWGGTVVVRTCVFRPKPERSVARVLLGVALGVILWSGAIVTDLVLKVSGA